MNTNSDAANDVKISAPTRARTAGLIGFSKAQVVPNSQAGRKLSHPRKFLVYGIPGSGLPPQGGSVRPALGIDGRNLTGAADASGTASYNCQRIRDFQRPVEQN